MQNWKWKENMDSCLVIVRTWRGGNWAEGAACSSSFEDEWRRSFQLPMSASLAIIAVKQCSATVCCACFLEQGLLVLFHGYKQLIWKALKIEAGKVSYVDSVLTPTPNFILHPSEPSFLFFFLFALQIIAKCPPKLLFVHNFPLCYGKNL